MAWLDDRIWAHPKIRDVPRATRWEYAASVAYASGFHTEGVLTAGQLKAIECTPKDRELLIAVGLWEDASADAKDGAIRIHDWKDHNGKRDQKRRADRLRKRAARAKDAEMSAGHGADSPADKPRTAEPVSDGQGADGPRVRDRRRPPDDGSDRVTEEGQDPDAAAELRNVESTSSTTAPSNDEEPELEPLQDPAAAVESPPESDIRAACQRFGADLNVVEPIARQLPGAIFAAVVMKHTVKVARGSAREVPALFVDLLKRELKDQAKAVAKTTRVMPPTRLPEADRPKPATGEDRIRLIVPTLTSHPFERVEETVRTWARAESWTPDELGHRLQLAHTIHGEHHEPDLDHAA